MKKFLCCATLFGLVFSANIAQSLHAEGASPAHDSAQHDLELNRNPRTAVTYRILHEGYSARLDYNRLLAWSNDFALLRGVMGGTAFFDRSFPIYTWPRLPSGIAFFGRNFLNGPGRSHLRAPE